MPSDSKARRCSSKAHRIRPLAAGQQWEIRRCARAGHRRSLTRRGRERSLRQPPECCVELACPPNWPGRSRPPPRTPDQSAAVHDCQSASRPYRPRTLCCRGASAATGTRGPKTTSPGRKAPGTRNCSGMASAIGHKRCRSSAWMVSSWPVARARSHPCTTRSTLSAASTCSAKVSVPVGVSHAVWASVGSSRACCSRARAEVKVTSGAGRGLRA